MEATPRDLRPLLELERACFPPRQAYGPADYRSLLASESAVNLVWSEEGRALGFVAAIHEPRQRAGHVVTLHVHPRARGRGVGRALLDECERRLAAWGAQRVLLEVGVANAAAIALYESRGYARLGRIEGYYEGEDVSDAFEYAKPLSR